MKKSLDYLPKLKQRELQKLVQLIRKNCDDVEMIILYGSYARGDYNEEKDIDPRKKSGHASDYDILVVTGKKDTALNFALWGEVSDQCMTLNLTAITRIITHDIKALNIKLSEGQYFFSDIKKEGVMLFDSEKFDLVPARDLTAEEKRKIAKGYYDEWYLDAEELFAGFSFFLERGTLKRAAFMLHQSAESAYKTVLLVFSNYCPHGHFLRFLGQDAEKYSDLLKNIFAKISKEDRDCFELLDYAYIGGRYDPDYRISREDLRILSEQVQELLHLTKKVCEAKIQSFK